MVRGEVRRILVCFILATAAVAAPRGLWAVPVITSITPSTVAAGGPGFFLSIHGSGFNARQSVLLNGQSRPVSFVNAGLTSVFIQPSDIAVSGLISVVVSEAGAPPPSNPAILTVTGPPFPSQSPPSLISVTPSVLSPGATGVRLVIQGIHFRPLAALGIAPAQTFSGQLAPAGISVDSVTVVNSTLIIASVTVSSSAVEGTRRLDVFNPNSQSTVNSGTSLHLTVLSQNSPGAPLAVSAVALTGPRNGTVVGMGDELYGDAILAGAGSGTVTGAWVWDGNVVEQFTAVLSGGTRTTLRSQHPFPTMLTGVHTLEVRILQPNTLISRPVSVAVSPVEFKTERLLWPEYGAIAAIDHPPHLHWAPVPGAARYEVGFSTEPFFSKVGKWYDVETSEWAVPDSVWSQMAEGQLYWTVRAVEISGSVHKPLPLRSIRRLRANALASVDSPGSQKIEGHPLPGKTDAEVQARARPGSASQPAAAATATAAATTPAVPPGQMQMQVGVTTQWVSGSAADNNAVTLANQMSMANGNWNLQTNDTGLVNSILGPEAQRQSLGRFNNYVLQGGYQRGEYGMLMRFGLLAPSLYQSSQLITTATPRQGVELTLKTRAGGMGFYANVDDLPPGGGVGAAFHQQLLGASWDAPLPRKYAEFRLMWLSARDSGTPAAVPATVVAQNLATPVNPASPGGGDLYGGLLSIHLPYNWVWNSEYSWGYNSLNLADAPHHAFGRAWQTGIAGTLKQATAALTYYDVGANFQSPANPGLSALGIPGRRGVNASLALPTRLGTFTLGDQFLQSNADSSTAVEQTMNAVTEGWSRQLDVKTVVSASLHETLTNSGDVPAGLQSLPPESLNALRADQRDLGAALTVSRQAGKATLSLSGTRDWNRNNLNRSADVITSSILSGLNWSNASFFQINSTLGVNWTAADKSTAGTTRALTGNFQPTLSWARPGLQVSPVVAFNQSRTQMLFGTLSNRLTTGQYGGRVTWTMPGDLKFSSLAFEGDFNRNKNLITNIDSSDKVLFLVWTLTWNRQRGIE